MPKEKGRPGHAVVRLDSDVGRKELKIAGLIPIIEHLRNCLDIQPDYFGLSRVLDDAVDDVVLGVLESPADSPLVISRLFRETLQSPAELHEMSMHNYKAWTPPEVARIREVELTRGKTAKLDDSDYARVAQYQWSASLDQPAVAQRKIQGEGRRQIIEYMHDLIMNPPKGTRVEHVNGDTLDNTRANLRIIEITSTDEEPNEDASICLSVEP